MTLMLVNIVRKSVRCQNSCIHMYGENMAKVMMPNAEKTFPGLHQSTDIKTVVPNASLFLRRKRLKRTEPPALMRQLQALQKKSRKIVTKALPKKSRKTVTKALPKKSRKTVTKTFRKRRITLRSKLRTLCI